MVLLSKHERRLAKLVFHFQEFVEENSGQKISVSLADWCMQKKELSQELASEFLENEIERRNGTASIAQSMCLYLIAFKEHKITVPDEIRNKINDLSKTLWRRTNAVRFNQNHVEKEQQYETLTSIWPAMQTYMRLANVSVFRSDIQKVIENRGSLTGIASSSIIELMTVVKKDDEALRKLLHCTLAFTSFMKLTGMRSLQAINFKLTDLQELDTNSFLLTRFENKCGNVRGVQKPVFVRVVVNKELASCSMVHLARHLNNNKDGLPEQVFAWGFKRKQHQSDEAFAKCVQRRFIAILHVVAIACGKHDGLGKQKLHAFRVMCENDMASKGIHQSDRQSYIGWNQGSAQANYSFLKHQALSSNVPYMLAEREREEDDPLLSLDVPGDTKLEKLQTIACALGLSDGMDVPPELVEKVKKAKSKRPPTKDELKRRVRDLEKQLQTERKKRSKLENNVGDEPVAVLRAFVSDIKAKKEDPQLLSKIDQTKLYAAIEQAAIGKLTFGVPLNTEAGKNLIRLLILCVLAKKRPGTKLEGASNWFAFVDKFRAKHPILATVDTSSWSCFLQST